MVKRVSIFSKEWMGYLSSTLKKIIKNQNLFIGKEKYYILEQGNSQCICQV